MYQYIFVKYMTHLEHFKGIIYHNCIICVKYILRNCVD